MNGRRASSDQIAATVGHTSRDSLSAKLDDYTQASNQIQSWSGSGSRVLTKVAQAFESSCRV